MTKRILTESLLESCRFVAVRGFLGVVWVLLAVCLLLCILPALLIDRLVTVLDRIEEVRRAAV